MIHLVAQPLDFQDESNPDTFIKGISQIETDGASLFLSEAMEPSVLHLDERGRLIERIGGKGQGPGELGTQGLTAISIQRGRYWILDGLRRAHYFEGCAHRISWLVPSFYIQPSVTGARTIAFDRDHVVIPVHPSTGHLAAVYDYGGTRLRYLGEILPIDRELLRKNPGLNDTHWACDGERWYCLFRYWPKLVVFDSNFTKIKETDLTGPDIDYRMGLFFGEIPSEYKGPTQPFFPDFQVLGGHLYFFCHESLYQLDKWTLKTVKRFQFGSNLPELEQDRSRPLRAEFFAVLQSGKVVFGWSFLPFEHDLWIAELTN